MLDPPQSGRPTHWVALAILAVLVTPLQCAGEELAFRGWLTQNVSAYFGRPGVGFVVAAVVSSGLFALAHGSLHVWVLLDLGIFALTASYLTWRTGGVEVGIALHCANNMLGLAVAAVIGGYNDGFVESDTTGTPLQVFVTLILMTVAVLTIQWQRRRAQPQVTSTPAAPSGRLLAVPGGSPPPRRSRELDPTRRRPLNVLPRRRAPAAPRRARVASAPGASPSSPPRRSAD